MTEMEICRHLEQKFEEFLQKIECPKLRGELKKRLYFAGGCIYCLRNDKVVKDYDMFLTDGDIIDDLKNLSIWCFTSEYALSVGKFQVVIKYFGEPDVCVGEFDFKHNMHYYVPYSGKIECGYSEEYSEDEEPVFDDFKYLQTNELFFNENRARDIEGVYLRIKKFVDRGMTISKETKRKIKKRVSRKSVRNYKKSYQGAKHYY